MDELWELVEPRAGLWSRKRDAYAIAAAFNKAGQLSSKHGADPSSCHRVYGALAAAYLPLVERLRAPADCTIPLHACAKAGYWGGDLATALVRRLSAGGGALLATAKDHEHSNLWWSLSEALKSAEGRQVLSSIDLPRLLEASAASLLRSTDIQAQVVSNILLACARLELSNQALTHHLTAALATAAPMAGRQALANSLYALGELAEDVGHTPRPEDVRGLARDIASRLTLSAHATSLAHREDFKPQELANMLLGCAKLGYTDPGLLSPLAAAAGNAAARMNPQEISNSLYSLALLPPSFSEHGPAVGALARAGLRTRFSEYISQNISNAAWALAKMGYVDQTWYTGAVKAAERPEVMRGAVPQAWSNVWYALALVRHQPASGRLLERTAEAAGELRQGAKAQECANLLWALANLRLYDERLVEALAGRLGELLGQGSEHFTGQQLCNCLWALAVMGPDVLSRHSGLVEGLLREAERRWAVEGSVAFSEEDMVQLWQVQLELAHVGGGELQRILLGAGEGREGSLLGAAQDAAGRVATDEVRASDMERQVTTALERLATRSSPRKIESIQVGFLVPELCRVADVVVELAGGRRVVVEVDGPWHFLANRPKDAAAMDGSTELRNRQLGRVFGEVHSIPFWDWIFKGQPEQEEVLCRVLGL
ncbi:hypothetical protein HYH03_004122 [Edaphochlamys debaryana]|uniref:RAP domain-containing protein n=1 Tax=Edaphochlamys debaryana TaxID=47281 RepID=A0A835YBN1_9CHLO|nr:hypothetical protein HYH03_004122 [Edaphochlamys debaryana]|eukprot:KAG2497856.1 hypothetical protein HYH03_004122 [Edaphochlamys debaryana]